jgi:hypothetical protein
VFVTAFARRAAYRPHGASARPWLYGIAHNLLRAQARRERRQRLAYLAPPAHALPRLHRIVARLAGGLTGQPGPVAQFRVITDLLYESPAPPALRAALYDLAATLPGVRLVRGAHDLVGRAATEVYQHGGWNVPGGGGQALFFRPLTGEILGWAELSGAGPQCPPLSVYAVLATGYVGSAREVPPGTPGRLLPATFRKHVAGCAAP